MLVTTVCSFSIVRSTYADEETASGEAGSGSEDCSILPAEAQEAAGCNANSDLIAIIVTNILYTVIFFSGLISVIFIVVGGMQYISSQGNAESVQKGKKTLLYATIGLIISSLAFVIVNFTINNIYNGSSPSENEEGNSESGISHAPSYSQPSSESEIYSDIGAGQGDEVTRIVLIDHKRVYTGNTEKLRAHIIPANLANKESITWASDNPAIVSVDSNGRINPKESGTATITAKTSNGKTASTKITVVKPVEPESISLEPNRVNMFSGKQFNLKATVLPANATNKHVIWSTDNAIVATVNNRGQITGRKAGNANITAKTTNGKTTSIPVKVTEETGEAIKITPSLLKELDYFYQTSHHEPISSGCGNNAGSVSCGPATYMVATYLLTKKKVDYAQFANEACHRWLGSKGSSIDALTTVYAQEYQSKYHVKVSRLPNTWEATVSELKKGHPVIFLVHSIDPGVAASQGYKLTNGMHYVIAISYRNQGGGQVYIWSPVSEKAAPGRNIGDCSEGKCWYDKATFERNINQNAWSVKKI